MMHKLALGLALAVLAGCAAAGLLAAILLAAGTFGWINPEWAQPGGSGAFEPWHWEFLPGTTQMGSNW